MTKEIHICDRCGKEITKNILDYSFCRSHRKTTIKTYELQSAAVDTKPSLYDIEKEIDYIMENETVEDNSARSFSVEFTHWFSTTQLTYELCNSCSKEVINFLKKKK